MTEEAQSKETPPPPQERVSSSRRRSSFFNVRRLSFFRSKGTRGADVETLRGNTGASFEGYARVARCGDYMNCCGMKLGAVKESTKKPLFLLLKGNSLFVFKSEDDPSPKYAIQLEKMQVEAEEEKSHIHGQATTDVLLKTALGDVEYIFTFNTAKDNNKDIVNTFLTTVRNAVNEANIEETKKRLGHEHQINLRASTVYANQIASEKVKDQPDVPINVNVTQGMRDYPTPFPVA